MDDKKIIVVAASNIKLSHEELARLACQSLNTEIVYLNDLDNDLAEKMQQSNLTISLTPYINQRAQDAKSVLEEIKATCENYGDPLPLEDLAESARIRDEILDKSKPKYRTHSIKQRDSQCPNGKGKGKRSTNQRRNYRGRRK